MRLIATGMERQGYRLSLTNVEPGTWRATFSSHPMLSAEGFGAAPTPWRAVQVAAWEALTKPEEKPPTPAEDIILP